MMKFSPQKKGFYRDLLYRIVIFAVTVSIIVYFLPRDSKFNYQFDINKPWKYGQLIATFDFPIYKSEDVIEREQDSILAQLLPYYKLDKKTGQDALDRLRKDYQIGALNQLLPSSNYLHYLEETLSNIYQTGILSSEELQELQQDSTRAIMVVDDKLSMQRTTNKLYSVKSAYQVLLNRADSLGLSLQILRQCPLNEYLLHNLNYDGQRTEAARKDALEHYSWAKGIVVSGQKIIDRGEIVDKETYSILESLRKESIARSETIGQQRLMLAGQILYVSLFILCFMLYLDLFRKDYYNRRGSLSLLFALVTIYCVATAFLVSHSLLSVYMIPYAMLPIIIRVFLDSRTAFTAQVTTILICSITLQYPHEFILLQIAGGLVAIFSLRELSQRSQLFQTAVIVMASYAILYFAYELITENDLSKMNWGMYTNFVINGVLLLFTYPLMFLVEKVFGFTSNVTLVELSNINTPLLRRLSETVPGTFQHSMQVANLSAEAANRIGAKSQLVRTGALYHDIGKMVNPVFFTENQQSGVNPHRNLSYEQSAHAVISHVTEGLKLADKYNLPKVIKDFITTHHGKGKTKYFYISWMNEHPGAQPDDAAFTYPGPNPFTREQAILMMADAVEAASRSLPDYTETSIGALVDKIIDSQVAEGYFKDCPITFHDIATVKKVFKEKLKTIYHTRISYPELKEKTASDQKQESTDAVQA